MTQSSPLRTRAAAVAGLFYPADRDELAQTLCSLLQATGSSQSAAVPKAIIAPHAGYIYSGPIAASAYALLGPARSRIRRVVLLGPVHHVAVAGLALPDAAWLETPLGAIAVDADAVAAIRHLPQVSVSAAAHAREHSLEVHLPFLQSVLEKFTLVPLAVGHADPHAVAEVLDILWGGPETLIVVSSDLSHYLPYREAKAGDERTAQNILACSTHITHEQACGATPLAGLAVAVRRHGLAPRLLDLRNSGDTAGDRRRVVGYGAFAFFEGPGHAG